VKIVLTGFGPFGEHEINPSQIVVEAIAERARGAGRHDVYARVLPVAYEAAGAAIRSLIASCEPDAVLCLGLAAGRNALTLERVALNLDDTEQADSAGETRQGQYIVPGGPVAYWSTLPLEAMREALETQGIAVGFSNDAGAYVCNHVFYVARHELERRSSGAPCGFVHLPLLAEQSGSPQDGSPHLDRAMMVRAVECCLEVLAWSQAEVREAWLSS
jgi:pyroglutamyl-peptidase